MDQSFTAELIEKFKSPWKQFAFRSYFIWIFILFGGLGIGLTIYDELTKRDPNYLNISHSIATTFIAVIAASLADINLAFNFKNIPSLVINSIGCIGLSILLLIITYNSSGIWSFISSIFGYLLSIVIWILANADNDKLNDKTYYNKMMDKAKELSENWGQE